jgi:hypothetical protein
MQIVHRDVHCNRDCRSRVQPYTALSKCSVQHPSGQWFDETDVLGQSDELVRRDHATLRMAPAHQCLDARQSSGQVHLRRILEDELVILDRQA